MHIQMQRLSNITVSNLNDMHVFFATTQQYLLKLLSNGLFSVNQNFCPHKVNMSQQKDVLKVFWNFHGFQRR